MSALKEAIAAKREIERSIENSLHEWQNKFGLPITSLDLERIDTRTVTDHAPNYQYVVRVRVELI